MAFWDRYSDTGGMSDLLKRKWDYQPSPASIPVYRKQPPTQARDLYCESCCEMRPWYAGDQCDRCTTEGPPERDPTSALSAIQVRILECLCEGHSVRAAARLCHVEIKEVEEMLEGRDTGSFRRAWQLLLEQNGITLDVLAKKAKEALEAEDSKWHPDLKEFITVPDNKTRLNATKWLATQHDLDPVHITGGGAPVAAIQVIFQTNLGDKTTQQTSNADYSFEINRE
jgi:hypothetical protein